jgi:glycerol-3-phosphate acyltransferase PlsY
MSPSLALLSGIAGSYLAGSVPFGLLVARARGVDIRKVGSGNIGATHVGRALGRKFAILVFALDFAKGLLPTLLLPMALLPRLTGASAALEAWLAVSCGLAAVIGHCFPLWLGFRGGKGVATTVGVLLALDWLAFLASGGLWIATLLVWRMVSLSSLVLGVAFPLVVLLRHGEAALDAKLPLFLVSLAVCALIAARHRTNVARILAGTEPKVFAAKRAAGER